jgi:hypothetical protein
MRLLGVASRVLAAAVVALTAAACSGDDATPSGQTTSSNSTAPGVDIPTSELTPFGQCIVDGGLTVVSVEPPQYPGDDPSYAFEAHGISDAEASAAIRACTEQFPAPELTDERIAATYDRWVKEYDCLRGLGYEPDAPPSVETFTADFRSSQGPWSPIDGVNTAAWSSEEYATAKSKCVLESYSRG